MKMKLDIAKFVGDVIFSLFQAITFIYTNFINFAAYPLPFRIEDYHLVDWIPMSFVCIFEESWLAFANFWFGMTGKWVLRDSN